VVLFNSSIKVINSGILFIMIGILVAGGT